MLSVLIVEDDLMIADMLEEALSESGYDVCGIARTVEEALALEHEHRPDLAIIDMRLAHGGRGTEVVSKVIAQSRDGPRIGILYATGNITNLTDMVDGDACIAKPYNIPDIVRGLEVVAAIVRTGTAPLPFPRGFRLLGERRALAEDRSHV